jgi:hypothetical protein
MIAETRRKEITDFYTLTPKPPKGGLRGKIKKRPGEGLFFIAIYYSVLKFDF